MDRYDRLTDEQRTLVDRATDDTWNELEKSGLVKALDNKPRTIHWSQQGGHLLIALGSSTTGLWDFLELQNKQTTMKEGIRGIITYVVDPDFKLPQY